MTCNVLMGTLNPTHSLTIDAKDDGGGGDMTYQSNRQHQQTNTQIHVGKQTSVPLQYVISSTTLPAFKRLLKTELFSQSFPDA